jgi:hypothetical protein
LTRKITKNVEVPTKSTIFYKDLVKTNAVLCLVLTKSIVVYQDLVGTNDNRL